MTLPPRTRLAVFTRFPVPGETKTRLIPALGPLGAARLQQQMTECILATARTWARTRDVEVEVRYTGGDRRSVRHWLGSGCRYRNQGAGDLGARLARTMRDAFAAGAGRVIVIGADCPSISPADLDKADSALDRADAVLGPAEDGGYWLIGLSRPAEVFADIDWGGQRVLRQTLARAERLGLRAAMLDRRADIDRPGDLTHLRPDLQPRPPWLSVIIPARNEADHIAAAVARASAEGVEVIVVDGDSDDATGEIAAATGATVLRTRPGRAVQMNAGAAAAAGEVLLFVHADTRLPDNYVRPLFAALTDARVPAGAFAHETDLPGPAMRWIERLVDFRARRLGMPYGDQAIFVRAEVFDDLGGYPLVPIAEDLQLMRKLRRLGPIAIVDAPAIASARRYRRRGILQTTVINQLVAAGCLLDVPDHALAKLYGTRF